MSLLAKYRIARNRNGSLKTVIRYVRSGNFNRRRYFTKKTRSMETSLIKDLARIYGDFYKAEHKMAAQMNRKSMLDQDHAKLARG